MRKYFAHAEGKGKKPPFFHFTPENHLHNFAESFLQIVSLGRPHAVGTIELGSSDPYAPPVIDPYYLSNSHDIRVLVEGMQKVNLSLSNNFWKNTVHFVIFCLSLRLCP